MLLRSLCESEVQRVRQDWTECRAALSNLFPTKNEKAAQGHQWVGGTTTEEMLDSLWGSRGEEQQLSSSAMNVVLRKLNLIHQSIQPFAYLCRMKLNLIKDLQTNRPPVRVGTLYNVAWRLGPHVKAPPEYNDPSGINPHCVPGFMFPCPDTNLMLKSMLCSCTQNAFMLKAIPPTISYAPSLDQPNTYELVLSSATPEASYVAAVNQDPLRAVQAPLLITSPGTYTVTAYTVAPNHLPSDMCAEIFNLTEETGTTSQPQIPTRTRSAPTAPPAAATAKDEKHASSVFSGLFLGEKNDESDDEDGSEEDDEESDGGSSSPTV